MQYYLFQFVSILCKRLNKHKPNNASNKLFFKENWVGNQSYNLAIYPISIDLNGYFGHPGQSQNGPKWIPISKNLGLDTKIKSLGLSKQKLQFWDFLVPWTYFWLSEMAKKDNFGHSGQSEVSGNGLNQFPMPKNLGIDTKIKSVACSQLKLQFWPI